MYAGDGKIIKSRIKELHTFEGLGRKKVQEVIAGDICAIVGVEGFEIGDTIACFENPEAFVSNQPTQVKFTLPDIAHQFKKGHRMMIQIQSSWFPLVDRNPQKFVNIYTAKDSDFQKATIKIYHGASMIQLPVLGN